jgi:hypothetical protein
MWQTPYYQGTDYATCLLVVMHKAQLKVRKSKVWQWNMLLPCLLRIEDELNHNTTTACPSCGRKDIVRIMAHLHYNDICRSAYMQREHCKSQLVQDREAQVDHDLLHSQVIIEMPFNKDD